MPKTARPVHLYDFTAFSRRTPTQQQPGDRLDAQFREHADVIAGLQMSLAELDRKLATQLTSKPKEPTLPNGMLGPNAGGFYAGDDKGATATSADYAQVSIDWAEHMPDTIPNQTMAINAITGDHWSSRWWANRAAQIITIIPVIGVIGVGQGVFCENLTVTGPNACSDLTYTPAGPVLLVVNGMSFLPVGSPAAFTVMGKSIVWVSTIYSLIPGQSNVAAWYPYAS